MQICYELWIVDVRSMISIKFTVLKKIQLNKSLHALPPSLKTEAGYNTGEENSRMYYLLALRRETGMDGE